MSNKTGKKILRIGNLIGTVLLITCLVWFFTHPDFYHNVIMAADGTQVTELARMKIVLMIGLVVAGLLALWVPCHLSEKQRRIFSVIAFLATSVVTIFALEYANIRKHRTPLWAFRDLGKKKLLMTWILVILVAMWFAVLFNRWQTASMMTAIAVCIFGVVCYLVYAMRGTPFLASDLTVLQTAANVAAEYEYSIDYYTLALVTFTISWSCIVRWAGPVRIFSGWKLRVAAAVVLVALTILFDRIYFHTQMLRENGVTVNTFRPEKSYGNNGSILTFLRSVQLMVVETPEGYSAEKVAEIAERYPGTSGNTEAESTKASKDETAVSSDGSFQPNVIIVMNEAFTDMQSWMDFETDKEVCPFFAGLTEDTIRGKLYVSSYGGRTANTEFEVLTGDSVGFLPPSATPYQLYIKDPMPNLDATLENEGYRHTVGMHPYRPSGYNRANVYELFGFDKLVFLDDFAGAELVSGKVSDNADVDRIIAEYEEAKSESDAPFFIHNVTMQNHSPYIDSPDAIGDPVHVTSGTGAYGDADTYLTLIHKSDQSLEKLVNYFDATDDPTVIIFFGDHQPKLADEFYQMAYGKTMKEMKGEELMQFYHSNYLIWANFDIEEKEMDLSTNYLIPVMKQEVGMDLTGYDQFLLDLHEDLPIVSLNGYWDKDGTYYEELEDKDSPWYERLQEYDMLVYNHLFDEDNRVDEFFGGNVPEAESEAS